MGGGLMKKECEECPLYDTCLKKEFTEAQIKILNLCDEISIAIDKIK